jgi:hypothetical protein
MSKNNNILFSASTMPSFGYKDDLVEKEICVYSDGRMTRREIQDDIVINEELISFSKELSSRVTDILSIYKADIDKLPNTLEHYVLDGSQESFQFGDKKVITWCIARHKADETLAVNEKYKDLVEIEKIQNNILDIYDEMARVINTYQNIIHLPTSYEVLI